MTKEFQEIVSGTDEFPLPLHASKTAKAKTAGCPILSRKLAIDFSASVKGWERESARTQRFSTYFRFYWLEDWDVRRPATNHLPPFCSEEKHLRHKRIGHPAHTAICTAELTRKTLSHFYLRREFSGLWKARI